METSPLTTGLALLCAVLGVALWSATSKNRDEVQSGSSSRGSSTSPSTASKNKKKKSNSKSTSSREANPDLPANYATKNPVKVQTPVTAVTEKQSKREKGRPSAAVNTSIESEAVVGDGSNLKPPQEQALKALLEEKALGLREMAHATSAGNDSSNSAPTSVEQSAKKRKAKGKSSSNGVTKTNDERRAEMDAQRSAGHRDVGADMLDKDLEPETTYTRVATIPAPVVDSKPKSVPVEDGWQSVSGKLKASSKPSQPVRNVESADSNAWASSNPFAALPGSGAEVPPSSRANGTNHQNGHAKPAASSVTSTAPVRSIPGYSSSGTDAQTKKQRQNAAKAAAKKAAKEGEEADRQARLNQHKRELEAERMREFYKKGGSGMPQPSSKWETVGRPKTLPKASINEKGSLVWD